MKKLSILAAMLVTLGGLAQASEDVLLLRPMAGDKSPSVTMTMDVYGTCGGAIVAVISADHEKYKNGTLSFSMDGGDVIIRRGNNKEISIKSRISDFNVLQCVGHNGKDKILFGSSCSGSACTDQSNYVVIDPSTLDVKPKGNATCDDGCANKLLGFRYLK
jgi:hypothetical protein